MIQRKAGEKSEKSVRFWVSLGSMSTGLTLGPEKNLFSGALPLETQTFRNSGIPTITTMARQTPCLREFCSELETDTSVPGKG